MYKLLFLLGWLLIVTHALEVATFPPVPTSLVAIKQKLKQKALHRQTVEDHQTRSLELEKLQLQRDLDQAESYRKRDSRFDFGGALSGAVSGAVSAATSFVKDQANKLIDKGKDFLGLGGSAPPPPPPPDAPQVDDDCQDECQDETEGEERQRLKRQKEMHDKMDRNEKVREARELEREQLEALREQELQDKLIAEEEEKKQNDAQGGLVKVPDDDPDDADEDGMYPTKPLRMRGKKRVCRDGNCWYAPTNIDSEGLDIETSADELKILRDRIAGFTGQRREGYRDGFEQGVNELRYFKQGYNLGFKEAKEEELREQREEANNKPVIPLDQTLESAASNLKDQALGAVSGALHAGVDKISNVVSGALSFGGGGSLFIEEDSQITKNYKNSKNYKKNHRVTPDLTIPDAV